MPLSGTSKPAITFKHVVLPDPEGPNSEKNSPSKISISPEVNSSTVYADIEGEEKIIRQISINLFESFTNIDSIEVKSIDNVTFQVELIKSGDVLITETFQRDDGVLTVSYTHLTLPTNREV